MRLWNWSKGARRRGLSTPLAVDVEPCAFTALTLRDPQRRSGVLVRQTGRRGRQLDGEVFGRDDLEGEVPDLHEGDLTIRVYR